MNTPVLIISDGAPGLIKAIKKVFSNSLRQRCLVHKKRNILSKITEKYKDEVGCKVSAILEAPNQKTAYILLEIFENEYGKLFPSAVKPLKDDLYQRADKKKLIPC